MFVLKDFKNKVRFFPRKEVSTDNLIFKLHYRLTFVFLLFCVVIVSSRQFVKEHINCIADKKVAPVINTFCFFSATFTVARFHNASYRVGTHMAYHGVGPQLPGDELKHHAYYQWVPFVLFIQGLMFYMPHLIWKKLENGRLSAIVNSVKVLPMSSENDVTINGHKFVSEETKRKREKLLKEIYLTSSRFKINRDWAMNLVVCELLNALNLIVQIYIVDAFLQGQFMDLGLKWWQEDESVLESVFPKVTKCIFHTFGSGGSMQIHDSICVMGLNIINEKIYVILWFWFVVLFVLTAAGLVWRLLTFLLHRRSGVFNRWVWGEVSPGPALKRKEIEVIATKLSFSDWLFLYYLGRNMDGKMFRRTVEQLTTALTTPLLRLRESEKSEIANESFC